MTVERDRVKAIVREELARRLPQVSAEPSLRVRAERLTHPALIEIYVGEVCSDDLDLPSRPRCVIEPDRPCYNSGYCKRLGY